MFASFASSIATPSPDREGGASAPPKRMKRKNRLHPRVRPWQDPARMEIRAIRDAHYRAQRGERDPEPVIEPVIEPAARDLPPVDIPPDFESLPWSRPSQPGGATLRGLVKDLGAAAVNRDQAIEVIAAAKDRQE